VPLAKSKPPRPIRIARLARKLAARAEARRHAKGARSKPLRRQIRKAQRRSLIAYDLETSRIKAGDPRVLYLTAHGADWTHAAAVRDLDDLRAQVEAVFLTPENHRARFVAWNGNHFDVYFIARALLASDRWILRPYLTRTKGLRGLKVIERGTKPARWWEFLDGIAMTGLQGMTLAKFLDKFAPAFGKLAGPDWVREEFNARNPAHVEYAKRDSEGLYHALIAAEAITIEHFALPLTPTIGNLGIRIFQSYVPEGVTCWEPPLDCLKIIRDQAMRGGYCHTVARYSGPIWKYDINQAYAAAMRDAQLPSGRVFHCRGLHPYMNCALLHVNAKRRGGTIPFYYKDAEKTARFDANNLAGAWITSSEYAQLRREGWLIEVIESYLWETSFTMGDYVAKLEALRTRGPDGKDDAQGLMMKSIGNNSYGKTVERTEGIEYLLALERPEGFFEYQSEDAQLDCVWFKLGEPIPRAYHQPQIGAFITAHVRMELRRAILLAPDAFIFGDTDCAAFTRAVPLATHATHYGKWKIEVSGDDYLVIDKKVYAAADGSVRHAKGVNVGSAGAWKLGMDQFAAWYRGVAPVQSQVQRGNFVSAMTGAPMFFNREKRGSIKTLHI